MTIALHLGVVDVPYDEPDIRFSAKAMGLVNMTRTTGDVAEILEEKYHVMDIFFELHGPQIAKDLEQSLAGALENLLAGSPINHKPFDGGTDKIEERFKDFLEKKEMDGLGYPGVPTMAALRGVNHRMKHPYKKRNPRPSFIDTGAYVNSFKAWVD